MGNLLTQVSPAQLSFNVYRSTLLASGWNTDGNTLGTTAANGALLSLFGQSLSAARFTLLRFIEGWIYRLFIDPKLTFFISIFRRHISIRYANAIK
jgi:hypothetical protein